VEQWSGRVVGTEPKLSGVLLSHDERIALVTGAIGGAVARRQHSDGFRVVAADLSAGRLAALLDELSDIETVTADVSSPAAGEKAVDTAMRVGRSRVDVLCTATGIAHGGAAIDKGDDDPWGRVIQANLQSVCLLCNRVAKPMLAHGDSQASCGRPAAGRRRGRRFPGERHRPISHRTRDTGRRRMARLLSRNSSGHVSPMMQGAKSEH
jgi:NAD(P)-dependent dehydrogenase (short-subunit alcohol dehydrogenase family)